MIIIGNLAMIGNVGRRWITWRRFTLAGDAAIQFVEIAIKLKI